MTATDTDREIEAIEKGEAWDERDEVVEIDVDEPIGKIVSVRLSAEQWEELRQEARALGIGPAALATSWVLERMRQTAKAGVY